MPQYPTREEMMDILNGKIENPPNDCWSNYNHIWKFWRKMKDAEGFRGMVRPGEVTDEPTPENSPDISC